MYPSSTLVEGLDIAKWTTTVEVKYFDRRKGKGLVAKEPISEGQVVWKEDPFVIAPEWWSLTPLSSRTQPLIPFLNIHRDIYDLQIVSRACAHCTTPLTERLLSSSSLVQRCTTTSSACPARFCNRLCLKRSETTHPLLCPAQNPASVPLLAFARKQSWMALHALARCTARLLLAHQQQGRQRAGGGGSESEGMANDWRVYCALADLGMEDRARGGW